MIVMLVHPLLDWRRLLDSLANINESPQLELPGAWKPPDNVGPLPIGKGEAA
jgi:hypothetical protein